MSNIGPKRIRPTNLNPCVGALRGGVNVETGGGEGLSPLEPCMKISLFGSTLLHLTGSSRPEPLEDDRFRPAGTGPCVAEAPGFKQIHDEEMWV